MKKLQTEQFTGSKSGRTGLFSMVLPVFILCSVFEVRSASLPVGDNAFRSECLINMADSLPDEVKWLPFNTGRTEMAPAVRNGYLYYIERVDDQTYANILLHSYRLVNLSGEEEFDPHFSIPDAYVNFTSDGKTVLMNILDEKGLLMKLLIGSADHINSENQLHEFRYNSKKYTIGRATISPDGQMLIFSSDRRKSEGGTDLWLCRKTEDGEWSSPENLGAVINTKENEAMPFLVSNSRLYFASQGHVGYGGYDLFFSDIRNGTFDIPVNMGSLVNTPSNETGICFSPETGLFYFASDRRGNYDIYSYAPKILPWEKKILIADEEEQKQMPGSVSAPKDPIPTVVPSAKMPDSTFSIFTEAIEDKPETIATEKDKSIDKSLPILPVATVPSGQVPALEKNRNTLTPTPDKKNEPECFYSVQLSAITAKNYDKTKVQKEFGAYGSLVLVKEEGWVKVRVGHFKSRKEAVEYVKQKKIKTAYIVLQKTK